MRHAIASAILILLSLANGRADFNSAVVREMNLARTNPDAYAKVVGVRMASYRGVEGDRAVREAIRFLQKARPLPPLGYSEGLEVAARSHVTTQGPTGAIGHKGARGRSMGDRISANGRWLGSVGENIHYGTADPRGVVVALIVDDGVRNRGHRHNIFSTSFSVAGAASGGHARYGQMCVIDFAGDFIAGGGAAPTRVSRPWTTLGVVIR